MHTFKATLKVLLAQKLIILIYVVWLCLMMFGLSWTLITNLSASDSSVHYESAKADVAVVNRDAHGGELVGAMREFLAKDCNLVDVGTTSEDADSRSLELRGPDCDRPRRLHAASGRCTHEQRRRAETRRGRQFHRRLRFARETPSGRLPAPDAHRSARTADTDEGCRDARGAQHGGRRRHQHARRRRRRLPTDQRGRRPGRRERQAGTRAPRATSRSRRAQPM